MMSDALEEPKPEFPDWSRGVSARKIAYYSGNPAVIAQFNWTEPDVEVEMSKLGDAAELSTERSEQMTPNQLAAELGLSGLQVRRFLRKRFPRSGVEFHTRWALTDEQVDVVRGELGKA